MCRKEICQIALFPNSIPSAMVGVLLSEHPEDGFPELSTVTLSTLSWVVTAHSELLTPTSEQAAEKQAWESPVIY